MRALRRCSSASSAAVSCWRSIRSAATSRGRIESTRSTARCQPVRPVAQKRFRQPRPPPRPKPPCRPPIQSRKKPRSREVAQKPKPPPFNGPPPIGPVRSPPGMMMPPFQRAGSRSARRLSISWWWGEPSRTIATLHLGQRSSRHGAPGRWGTRCPHLGQTQKPPPPIPPPSPLRPLLLLPPPPRPAPPPARTP